MGVLRDRNLQIVIAVIILAVTGGSLVGPMLPAMLEPFQVGEERIGLVLSAYTLTAMLSTPFLGVLADTWGRKPVLVGATLLFGVCGLLLTQCSHFSSVLALRALQGIAVGGMMNTGVTVIGDLFSGVDRARAMGYRMSFQTVTNATIPFLSGALATLAWFYPFFLYTLALPVGALAWSRLRLPAFRQGEPQEKRRAGYIREVAAHILQMRAVWVFACNFFGFVLLYVLVVYMPILVVNRFSLSTLFAGLGMSCASGMAALASAQSGLLASRFRETGIVLAGFACCMLALGSMPIPESFPLLLPCFVLWGLGFGTLMPALNTSAAGLAPGEYRAAVVSVFTMTIYLGQTLSPPLFGAILARSDLDTVFHCASVLGLAPLLLTLAEHLRRRPRRSRAEPRGV